MEAKCREYRRGRKVLKLNEVIAVVKEKKIGRLRMGTAPRQLYLREDTETWTGARHYTRRRTSVRTPAWH
jgi:hypothetical protein